MKPMMDALVLGTAIALAGAAGAGVEWWAVPAMSGVARMPDAVPADGVKGGAVKIVAAKGEYEPGSFVVRSDVDLGKVKLEVSELKRDQGGEIFPKENVDLKVVKVWLQNKNAWFSFFADTGTKLCPELLLNDEDLIRVDETKQANYARIVDKDGKTSERWLNPPRLMDKRYYDHYRETTPFQPMRPGFADAATLQPVALAKDVSKQFFLTVRTLPEMPAGVYRGEVKVKSEKGTSAEFSVPVVVRVLDFELPKPKAYVHPEMDFRVCFYDYISRELIMKENGGDEELMWKQLEAILADQVAHGQDMKWVNCRTASVEGERTLAIMKKVGMRTDAVVGGIDYVWNEMSPEQSTARAYRIADYYDRTLGHHNIYGGYGDEPGAGFFAKARPVFESYQKAGLKFLIASREHIVNLEGFRWDWHNASMKSTDSSVPSLWNQMGSDTHCAWYADQHVGCENPEFNRRQNGLGAYLSGYSALCNYAHHLGPFNDDSDTYKPMVFAYGTANGVIDTLQWEGFREGLDDIRYATLMMALAREADKSDDLEVRHLGRKAKLYLTVFNRETGDLAAARGEMIGFIGKFRAALGAKANVTIAAAPAKATKRKPLETLAKSAPEPVTPKNIVEARKQADEWVVRNDLKGAIAVFERLAKVSEKTPWVVADCRREIGNLYGKFYLIDEQIAYYKKEGLPVEAAKVMLGRSPALTEEAYKLAEQELDRALAAKDQAAVRAAWFFLLEQDRVITDLQQPDIVKLLGTGAVADAYLNLATGLNVGFNGDWERMRKYFDVSWQLENANTNRLWAFKTVQYALQTYLTCGNRKLALAYVDLGLKTAAKNDKRIAYKPEDVYFLELAKATIDAKGESESQAAIAKGDAAFGAQLAPKLRKERIERLAAFRLCGNDEAFARGAKAYLDKMAPAQPDKTYVVKFSPKRIRGLGGWEEAAKEVRPDTAKLDRAYGGNTEYLWTDVSTGRGEVNQDTTKRYARNPEWQAMTDAWGVHFRLEVFDEQAKEIAAGFASAGSLEGYIAPGANTPYVCLLHSFQPGGFTVYNGVYSQKGHRWVSEKDRVNCREDIAYTDGSVIIYWAFSWNIYATRIPKDGALWDFEPMLWGRKACLSWNGLKTIHGRSSWGHLQFALSSADRRAILRPVILAARKGYEDEKKTYGTHEGVLHHWQNVEVGDPAFYESVLKPVVEELDVASKKVSLEMDDQTVDEPAETALPRWHDFGFEVGRLRADYLLNQDIPEVK